MLLIWMDDGRQSVFAFPVAWILSVFFHETGHLAGALAGRFNVLLFAVWPLKFYRTRDSWRVEFWATPLKTGFGGFVGAYPVGSDELVPRVKTLIACGPVASVVLTLSAWIVARYTDDGSSWLPPQLKVLALVAALHAIFSLWPMSTRLGSSDGARLLELSRGGEKSERFASLLVLIGCSTAGKRPRDWDPELVQRAAGSMDDERSDAIAGQMMRYNWLLDTKRTDQAGSLLDWITPRIVTLRGKRAWELEKIWFDARHRDTPPAAGALGSLAASGQSPSLRCAYFKTKAALDLLEHRYADAEIAARESAIESEKLADRGIAAALRDESEALLREATARAQAAG